MADRPKRLDPHLQPAGEEEGVSSPGPEARSAAAGRPPADAHESLELRVGTPEAIERVWRAYWLPMLAEDGKISVERLKGELFDAWHLVNEARKVYRHVTGSVTDDLTASADGIIAMAERKVSDRIRPLEERIRQLEAEVRALLRERKPNGADHG